MKVLKKLMIMLLAVISPISAEMLPHAYATNTSTSFEVHKEVKYYNGFGYNDTGNSAEILSYTGSSINITVPSEINGKTVTAIKNGAFLNKADITSVSIPSTVTSIGNKVFRNCSSLSAVTFLPGQAENDLSLGERVFEGCTSLCGIQLPGRTKNMGSHVFFNSGITEIALPAGITSIPSYTFYRCNDLSKVTFASGTVSIGTFAFCGCVSLTEISLPKTVTSLGESSFQDCEKLSLVRFSSESNAHKDLIIGRNAFLNCHKITGLKVPQNTLQIGNGSFKGTGITSFIVPENVTSVGERAFENCSHLESIAFEQSDNGRKMNIGKRAFYNCELLKSVDIPANLGIELGWGAFEECIALTGFSNPLKADIIQNEAFKNCFQLNNIELQNGLTSLGERVFGSCLSLTSFTVPNGIEYLPKYLFSDCTSLTQINIPDSVALLNEGVFQNCVSLISVKLPKNLSRIDNYAFKNCAALTNIKLPDRVRYIGDSAFYGCRLLTGISTPQSISVLGSNAFYGCSSLKEFILPAGITGINEAMFYNCTDMAKIWIGCNVDRISSNAFQSCSKLSIYGESGSYAESFAQANGFTFVPKSNAAVLLQIVHEHELDDELSQDDVFSVLSALNCNLTQLTPELISYGDFNGDGRFDILDAYQLYLRFMYA